MIQQTTYCLSGRSCNRLKRLRRRCRRREGTNTRGSRRVRSWDRRAHVKIIQTAHCTCRCENAAPAACMAAARRSNFILQLRGSTWAADSHGLFDYESSNLYSRQFRCNCQRDSYSVLLKDTELLLKDAREAAPAAAHPLVNLFWKDGCFWLAPPPRERLWLVVRSVKDHLVMLHPGDVIKLGRYRLRVRDVIMKRHDRSNGGTCAADSYGLEDLDGELDDDDDCETVAPCDPTASNNFLESSAVDGRPKAAHALRVLEPAAVGLKPHLALTKNVDVPPTAASSFVCRICLCGAEDDEDSSALRNEAENDTFAGGISGGEMLVSPCRCAGSMKWVHLKCLRTWMTGRLSISPTGNTNGFFWRTLECELCKTPYPRKVTLPMSPAAGSPGGAAKQQQYPKTIDLFQLPRLEPPYVLLEPRGTGQRGIHIVSLAQGRIARLGRGHESDIRLPDISVSRIHANLRWLSTTSLSGGGGPLSALLNTTNMAPTSSRRYSYGSGPPAPVLQIASTPILPPVQPMTHDVGATLAAEGGCLALEDVRSKFGTLLELRKPIRLDPDTSLSVQIGRTVLVFTLKRRWRFALLRACLRHAGPLHHSEEQSNASDIVVVQDSSPLVVGGAAAVHATATIQSSQQRSRQNPDNEGPAAAVDETASPPPQRNLYS